MALDTKSMKWRLYGLNMANEWHLIFVGYTEEFAKTFLENVCWSRWIDDTCYGIDGTGWYYKIIEDKVG